MNPPEAKIYGIQRTGTNWLTMLLQTNYSIALFGTDEAGWKHGRYCALKMLGREVHLIITVKHPYSWLVSAWRHRQAKHWEFPNYVRESVEIERWNWMYRHWLDVKLSTRQKVIVRYETILTDPEAECERMSSVLGIKRTESPFYVPTCRMNVHSNETDARFSIEYYQQRKWMNEYDDDLLEDVNARVDWNVASELGYDEAVV